METSELREPARKPFPLVDWVTALPHKVEDARVRSRTASDGAPTTEETRPEVGVDVATKDHRAVGGVAEEISGAGDHKWVGGPRQRRRAVDHRLQPGHAARQPGPNFRGMRKRPYGVARDEERLSRNRSHEPYP